MTDTSDKHPALLASVTQIVTAHLANDNTALPTENVSAFIREIYETVKNIDQTPVEPNGNSKPEAKVTLTPAVPIDQSVSPEYIICLEDGKPLKMLKRHLMSRYQMTPEQYRKKWNLPKDYPMVASSYAERRAVVARNIGLGRKNRTALSGSTGETKAETAELTLPETLDTSSSATTGANPQSARRTRPAKPKPAKTTPAASKNEQAAKARSARPRKSPPSAE